MKISVLGTKLSKLVSGQVLWNNEILEYYSVDSSSYQIRPKVVVIPKSIQDVIAVVKFASKNKVPVTPRGAGTGLVGSAIGDGIIVDMKNFDKIKVLKNSVVVGAGALKGNLDIDLKKHKKFFGPNPSIGPYCSIGGMIATNASGSHTLKYGATIDNLLQVTIISSYGKVLKFPSNKNLENTIYKIARTIDLKNYPDVSKNSCGYRLDTITNSKNAYKIFSGAEGTLGIIISAKLKIYNSPKTKFLQIISYDSLIKAANDCPQIIKLKPSALEFVDQITLKNIKYKIPSNATCLLFAEFDNKIQQNTSKLKKLVHGRVIYQLSKEYDIAKWWKFRDLSLAYSLKSISKDEKAPHIIEDATVPIENLDKLMLLIGEIKKMSKGRTVIYGHAGNGNLHVRLISKNKNKKLIEKIAKYYFSKVIQLGGTISGEHGDGLARSRFVRLQYGEKTYLAFKKIKKLLDPTMILNPEKIITNQKSITKNLCL